MVSASLVTLFATIITPYADTIYTINIIISERERVKSCNCFRNKEREFVLHGEKKIEVIYEG